jgi:diguanylate cyclase (GGDEF)-like protein
MKPPADSASSARVFRPLSRRVVAWALLYSTLFTLVMTAVLVGVHYLDERDAALRQLRFAADSYKKSLANSLWDLDMPSARLQVESLANFPMVGHAVVETTIGQTLAAGKQDDAKTTLPGASGFLAWQETLFSPQRPDYVVGRLQLHVDRAAFLQRIEASALRILVGELFKGLAFGLLMAWLIDRIVTRHLADMAAQVASLNPASLRSAIVLRRRPREYEDELDRLRDAFNRLHHELASHIDAQRALETELRRHRDRLSDMVADRTRSLEQLRGFHSLIIRVLTRFINLPPTQANAAVDNGLGAFGEYFGAQRCLLFMHDDDAMCFRVANSWPTSELPDTTVLQDADLPPHMLESHTSRLWLHEPAGGNAPDAAISPLRLALSSDAYTLVGVEVKGDTIGLLCLLGRAIAADDDNANLLELAARVAANMLDHKTAQMNLLDTQQALERANRELHDMSRHDALTGLANRRHFDDIKEVEFRRAMRAGSALSVLMCDIDDFKRYNDTYGHAKGDRCLVDVAHCLGALFGRAGELLVRLGGEEFVVLLPNTNAEQARVLGERVRQAVWEQRLPHASSTVADRITMSVGVATLKPGTHKDFDALLHDADVALYHAKDGRNRVATAE